MQTSFLVGVEEEKDIDSLIKLENVLENFNWYKIKTTNYKIINCYETDTKQKPAIYLPHSNKKK